MKHLIIILILSLFIIGCGASTKVYRIDEKTVTDLSGKWNDTDARLVAEEMISDCLSRPWLSAFNAKNGEKPVVTVGTIRNKTDEHIDTETFSTDFERELINSAMVRFVARKTQRDEMREERFDQSEFASKETVKQLRAETGADYVLMGAIKTIIDQAEGIRVVFYQTDLELIDVESMEKVWIGTKKIKKEISKDKTKW